MKSLILQNTDVLSRKTENGVLLFNTSTNELFQVNSTGGRIWELIGEKRSAEQIAEIISREYRNAELPRVRSSLQKFLQQLGERRLLSADE